MPKRAPIFDPITPERIRYIKLGDGGSWESECLSKGIVRIGFGSYRKDRFLLCSRGKWDELYRSFRKEGKDKGTATRFMNETKYFFEDEGQILWITFMDECLCWGFMDHKPAVQHNDGDGVYRKIIGGWKQSDAQGERLTKEKLAGGLLKLAAYRGTSCEVEDVFDYVVRRINAVKSPEIDRALSALTVMRKSALEMIQLLGPKDFEVLVDLVFSTSGWRRLGVVGKTQKTLDLDLVLPSTSERAFVQVKSRTSAAELKDYHATFKGLKGYDRMFFVYHTGTAYTDDKRVTVIDPEKLAEMVVDAGLHSWLMKKIS